MTTSDRPTLSVALATYNGERYLSEQLASYISQTRQPDEVVVRDDGSTDGTMAILERFAETAPFAVRVLPGGENLGYARNFERVLAACGGDLIALSDQDDVWLPHKLARLQAALGDHPERLLAFSDAFLVDQDLKSLGRTAWESIPVQESFCESVAQGPTRSPLLWRSVVCGATMCFRSPLVSLALPNPIDAWHDSWISIVASLHGLVVPIDEPLNLYRQHGGNVIGAGPERDRHVGRRAARALQRFRQRRDLRTGPHGVLLTEGSQRMLAMLSHARERYADALPPEADRALRRASDFHAFRVNIPDHPQRLASLLRQLAVGHYHSYGDGWRAPAVDLLR